MRRYTSVDVRRIQNGYICTFVMKLSDLENYRRAATPADQFDGEREFTLHCADAERVALAIHKYLKE